MLAVLAAAALAALVTGTVTWTVLAAIGGVDRVDVEFAEGDLAVAVDVCDLPMTGLAGVSEIVGSPTVEHNFVFDVFGQYQPVERGQAGALMIFPAENEVVCPDHSEHDVMLDGGRRP